MHRDRDGWRRWARDDDVVVKRGEVSTKRGKNSVVKAANPLDVSIDAVSAEPAETVPAP
jgi:hypothetical protein